MNSNLPVQRRRLTPCTTNIPFHLYDKSNRLVCNYFYQIALCLCCESVRFSARLDLRCCCRCCCFCCNVISRSLIKCLFLKPACFIYVAFYLSQNSFRQRVHCSLTQQIDNTDTNNRVIKFLTKCVYKNLTFGRMCDKLKCVVELFRSMCLQTESKNSNKIRVAQCFSFTGISVQIK